MYNGYDAFIMQWKCYGANGHVNKPDYSEKGLVDTYTEPIKGYVPTKSLASLQKLVITYIHIEKISFGIHINQVINVDFVEQI